MDADALVDGACKVSTVSYADRDPFSSSLGSGPFAPPAAGGAGSWPPGVPATKKQKENRNARGTMNPFEAAAVLGLDPARAGGEDGYEYSPREIARAYRRQALKHHPDKSGGGGASSSSSSSSGFQRLQTAKDVLLRRHAGEATTPPSGGSFVAATALCRIVARPPRRTCIRQVLVHHRPDGEGGRRAAATAATIVAASDDGLILQNRSEDGHRTFLEGHLFLCCAVNDGTGGGAGVVAYAGTSRGNLAELDLTAAATGASASAQREASLWRHCGEGIVAMVAVRDHPTADAAICTGERAQLLKIVVAPGGRKGSVTLWQSPKDPAVSPEVLGVDCGDPRAASAGALWVWIGGSDAKDRGTGRFAVWTVGVPDLQGRNDDVDDDEFCWNCDDSAGSVDTDDSGTGGDGDDDGDDDDGDGPTVLPAVDVAVEEGPLFAMARQDRRLAVAAGKSVVVWDCVYGPNGDGASSGAVSCCHRKTLRTDSKLYTVAMNPAGLLAAAGSGECILVWDMNSWSLTHKLMLRTVPKGCCLSTNCIMSLDWGDVGGRTLACGGYDGCISLWTLAHRLTG